MPTLHWVGKDKVVRHHHDVPFKVLQREYRFASANPSANSSTGNRIIHGDNLEALKALLPEYEGRIKCIYIDPPYNTGNEGWVYNDNVNDPRILKWLHKVVGKEGEDLSRHDKWLCMMYPRLKLLHRLLAEDGVVFVSIDRIELANLKVLFEEIFGSSNWVGEIIWRNVTDNNPTNISLEHEYILCYAKNKSQVSSAWKSAYLDVKEKLIDLGSRLAAECTNVDHLKKTYSEWLKNHKNEIWPFQDYKFIDFDGIYTGSRSVHNPGKEGYRYDVLHPKTGKPCTQPLMGYRFPEETMKKLIKDEKIIFGEDENKIIELKLYVKDYKAKLASVIEMDGRAGTNEIKTIFPEDRRPFNFPKPSALIEELLGFTTGNNDIILDSFAGSGTTAHAVLKLNAQDGGKRKFILVEMMDYAETITAERVRRVMEGYGEASPTGKGGKQVEGLGGGFEYFTLGEALFNEDGQLNEAVGVEAILRYVAYSERIPLAPTLLPQGEGLSEASPLGDGQGEGHYYLGETHGVQVYFIYQPDRATSLDLDVLAQLPVKPGKLVIYADQCLLGEEFMRRHGILFKKIPRDMTRF
ncbi:MAG: site-specific DNA-methyltransferase [Candidatus Methylumidiphilus sp.]